jgi:oligogalacturonide transporter
MKKHSDTLGKIAYACGDIYGGGSFLIVGLLLLVFLTKVERLPGVWAGAIIFVGKAWDAVTDPLMGMLSDRTRSKFGRRRFYFLIGAIPVFVSWVMLWYSFGITGETAKIIYYMIAFMFFSTAFTIVMVPYNAILADMTDDYNKRSAFTGVRLSFSAGAAILCGTVPGMIMGNFADEQTGYLIMALIFGIVFGVSWLAVFFGTWENTKLREKTSFSYKDWFSVVKNRSFRIYSMIFIFSQMAIDITMAMAAFYLSVALQKDDLFITAMAAILVVQLIFIIVFSKAAQKFGKKIPGIVAATVWILADILIFTFTPKTPELLIVPVCALIGVGAAGCNLVSWSILPDISDVDELMTGKRREGLYSGVSTFLRKLAGGIAVGAAGIMLDIFRYNEAAVSSGNIEPVTVIGVKLLFLVLPALLLAVMLLFLRKYRLGKDQFAMMHDALTAFRKDGAAAELSSEQAAVFKQITGVDETELFGS